MKMKRAFPRVQPFLLNNGGGLFKSQLIMHPHKLINKNSTWPMSHGLLKENIRVNKAKHNSS